MSGRTQVAELKPVVSLFVQFHGIDYDSDPQIAERLQAYFALAQQIVARYGGRLNRLITGDKGSLLHIIFGAPTAIEEREIRATRCALDLQRECGSMPFISMQRIGMAGGRVFAGPVGGPVRHDYTTMGDAINLSARLMQNAADNQILIDTSVQSQLNIAFTISDLGQIRVKGKAEPIQVFAVLAFHETLARQRPAPQIYGRDQERAQLRNLLANFQQGGIVILTGEVGVGKTMMIAALQAEASTIESPPRWLSAIALAYGQTLSGYLFIDIVRELLDLQAGMGPDEAHLRLRAICIEYFGAAELARELGIPIYNPLTEQRLQEWLEDRQANTRRKMADVTRGTIGVVALDLNGQLCAGTSTGGRGFERIGRVSDSATTAGNYATEIAAVSCTGVGEDILNEALATRIVVRVTDGLDLETAMTRSIAEAKQRGRDFGAIALDQTGAIAWGKTCPVLFSAYHDGEKIGDTLEIN